MNFWDWLLNFFGLQRKPAPSPVKPPIQPRLFTVQDNYISIEAYELIIPATTGKTSLQIKVGFRDIRVYALSVLGRTSAGLFTNPPADNQTDNNFFVKDQQGFIHNPFTVSMPVLVERPGQFVYSIWVKAIVAKGEGKDEVNSDKGLRIDVPVTVTE